MPVKNSEYWKKRMERLLVQNEKSAIQYEQELKSAYQKTLQAIQTEMEAFFHRYARKNRITYADARQRLSNTELKSFQERQNIYLEEVKRLGNNKVYEAYLRNLSGKAYVTKLEEITANIRYHIESLSTNYTVGLGDLLKNSYENSYYTTMYDVQKQMGVGVSFTAPGDAQLNAAISEKWLDNNYSGRIWQDKQKLIITLNQLIPQEFVRGRSNQEIAQDLAKRMNVSYSNAVRLIRTETNYISNKGTLKAYADSTVVERFLYLATLDSRTSDICRDMDGEIFNLKDAKIGVNVPPLHPNCRSTTVPYFEPDELDESMDRIARDSEGKSYRVGSNVTFKEWVDNYAEASYAKKIS